MNKIPFILSIGIMLSCNKPLTTTKPDFWIAKSEAVIEESVIQKPKIEKKKKKLKKRNSKIEKYNNKQQKKFDKEKNFQRFNF